MVTRSNILYRLALFWARVPPDLVMVALLAVPGIFGFLAGLPWILNLAVGSVVTWWVTAIFNAHVWPELTPGHRETLLALRDRVLLLGPDRTRSLRGCPDTRPRRALAGPRSGQVRWKGARKGDHMVDAHEAAKYVENKTSLADDVFVTSQGERTATLQGVHKRADGSDIEVTIEIRDNGPRANEHRYEVDVFADGVEPIRANPAATLTEAISNADAHSSGLG